MCQVCFSRRKIPFFFKSVFPFVWIHYMNFTVAMKMEMFLSNFGSVSKQSQNMKWDRDESSLICVSISIVMKRYICFVWSTTVLGFPDKNMLDWVTANMMLSNTQNRILSYFFQLSCQIKKLLPSFFPEWSFSQRLACLKM